MLQLSIRKSKEQSFLFFQVPVSIVKQGPHTGIEIIGCGLPPPGKPILEGDSVINTYVSWCRGRFDVAHIKAKTDDQEKMSVTRVQIRKMEWDRNSFPLIVRVCNKANALWQHHQTRGVRIRPDVSLMEKDEAYRAWLRSIEQKYKGSLLFYLAGDSWVEQLKAAQRLGGITPTRPQPVKVALKEGEPAQKRKTRNKNRRRQDPNRSINTAFDDLRTIPSPQPEVVNA